LCTGCLLCPHTNEVHMGFITDQFEVPIDFDWKVLYNKRFSIKHSSLSFL